MIFYKFIKLFIYVFFYLHYKYLNMFSREFIKHFFKIVFLGLFYYFSLKSIIFEYNYQILFESSILCETSSPLEDEKSDLYKFCEMHERNTCLIEEKITNTKIIKPRNYVFEFLLFTTIALIIGLDKFYCIEEDYP